MSNVRKRERSQHRLTVLDRALDLYEHTSNLLSNPKYQTPNMKVLTIKIDNAATVIYHNCRSANEDLDARKPDEARMRIELQAEAIVRFGNSHTLIYGLNRWYEDLWKGAENVIDHYEVQDNDCGT